MIIKTCKCKVCVAFKTQKLKIFCVVWGGTGKDYIDYHFLGVNKTKRQFESALKKARQTVAERQPVPSRCFELLCDVLSNAGFVEIDDLSCCSTAYIDIDPPEIPGATISFDKVY